MNHSCQYNAAMSSMPDPKPNTLIAYNLHKGSALAVITECQAKNLRVTIKNRKEFPIKANEVFALGPAAGKSPSEWVDALVNAEQEVDREFASFDMELLHAMLLEQPETGVTFSELVQLYFGPEASFAQTVATARSLEAKSYLVRRKKELLYPTPSDQVRQYLEQLERMQKRQEALQAQVAFLNSQEPVCEKILASDFVQDLIDLARSWPPGKADRYHDALQAAHIRDVYQLRDLLIQRQILSEDTFFEFYESHFPDGFSEASLNFDTSCHKIDPDHLISDCGFVDLRSIPALTVDGDTTLDRDDALSITEDGSIMLHVSLVCTAIGSDQKLEKEIRRRLTSIYLPEITYPMFPQEIISSSLSLDENETRAVITVQFHPDNPKEGFRVFPAVLRIERNLTYTQFQSEADGLYLPFFSAARKLKAQRIADGAVIYHGKDLEFEFGAEIVPCLRQTLPSMDVIAELSITANSLLAYFCHQNEIPIFYRNQNGNPTDLRQSPHYSSEPRSFYQYYHLRKLFGRTAFDIRCKGHVSMGLTHYTQMTSPIRRYLDYLNQKQLLAYLLRDQEVCKPDAMGISELEQHGMGLFATLQEYSGLQDKRKKHWLLKALSARLSVATDHKILLPVEILEVFDEDVLYYLSDFGVIFKGRRNLDSMRPGDHIHLELRAVKLLDRELIGEFRKVVIMENR